MTNTSGAFGKWIGRNFPRSNKWEKYFLRPKKMKEGRHIVENKQGWHEQRLQVKQKGVFVLG